MHSTLITPAHLATRIGDRAWVIVDCRFDLAVPEAGVAAYRDGHIPGAVHADLDRDLSGPRGPATGRHPLPDPQTLAATFGRWGIGPGVQVVAYDAASGMFAARLWWLLRWLGHDAVAVLDGGMRAWQDAGLPLENSLPTPQPREFIPAVRAQLWAGTDEVARSANDPGWRILDARAAPRYAGEVEPIDPVAGHVPGAHNFPYERNLTPAATLRGSTDLRQTLTEALGPVPADRTIVMCGSGVTACHVLLALAAAGLEGARLYPGSWSEWIRDPARPIATGPAP